VASWGHLEANAPLHVAADAVLPCPVAFQGFEAVAGQGPQILKACRGVQHVETFVGLPVETLKLPDKKLDKVVTTLSPYW
jgi:hypothetical protein